MKLRDKKTGAIYSIEDIDLGNNKDGIWLGMNRYKSLAELNAEWEDYEEPKEYWYIEPNGVIARIDEWDCCTDSDIEIMKTLGNYFETKEEAKKAVEKLKAWKRLKDKGVEFYGWRRNHTGTYDLLVRWEDRIPRSYEVKKDLDLLFGGKE